MAQEVAIIYRSDISKEVLEGDDVQHLSLALDNQRVNLDLSTQEAEELKRLLGPYLAAGSPAKPGADTKAQGQKRPDTGSGLADEDKKAVRQWWKHAGTVEGFEPKDRGRIPKPVIDAWLAKGKPSFE